MSCLPAFRIVSTTLTIYSGRFLLTHMLSITYQVKQENSGDSHVETRGADDRTLSVLGYGRSRILLHHPSALGGRGSRRVPGPAWRWHPCRGDPWRTGRFGGASEKTAEA